MCINAHTESVGCFTVFIKAAAFIYGLQHLTEDGNGVLWVRGNPMPLLQIRDAGAVHLQTGKHLPETWEGITQSPLLRPASIWRAGLSSTQSQMHIIHRGHGLESSNIFILSDVHLFLLLLLFPPPIAFVSSLVFFIHQQMYRRVKKNLTGTRSSFSSCFCSHSLICLSQTVGSVLHASTFIIVRQTFPGAIDKDRCRFPPKQTAYKRTNLVHTS